MKYFDLPPVIEHMLKVSDEISDLNFSVNQAPQVEINGRLTAVEPMGLQKLTPYQTEIIAMTLMQGNPDAAQRLAHTGSTDISYSLPSRMRFRVNIFQQRGTYSIVMRVIPTEIRTLENLGLPQQLADIAELRNGIVLITGPTGSGKSTTLAAIIDLINEKQHYHIVTIEDPIEFLHHHKKSTINQREVGSDAKDFSSALRAALRQAPKVILIGEMRDYETTEIALEAAETGHLVLSTLHTIDASKTIDRVIGLYPKNEEQVIRARLAQTFRYIVSQRLIPRGEGGGRVSAVEVLKSTPRTRDYISAGECEGKSLLDAMRDGKLDGMQDFDTVIKEMIEAEVITLEDGLSFATNPNNLQLALKGMSANDDFNVAESHTAPAKRPTVTRAYPVAPLRPSNSSILDMIE
ncbi:MAG: twitching motility protein PilT [Acidobacteriota bacterium]|jgi:twitching motility protein PilT|nr:twitching motility protein PilT [Acidobacteriota bacterium]MDT5263041.1 twitching motility protein PilT [Acidobacteriota bacterium]MDT7781429.1 twitching motility protein PilT [Acidobacteriota bacterium]